MEGFFTQEQLDRARIQTRGGASCLDCGLYQNCNSPKMGLKNEGKRNLIVLPGPTEKDDGKGSYLSGNSGNFLKRKLIGRNFHLNRNFSMIGATQCHIGKIPKIAIASCRSRLKEAIDEQGPKNIIPLGSEAIEGLLGESFKKTSIERFRGLIIPDQEYGVWILPTFTPGYICSKKTSGGNEDPNAQAFYNHEWSRIIKHCRQTPPFPVIPDERENVICLYNYEQIIDILKRAYSETDSIVVDYETTGLKPFTPGHKIVSISIDFNGKSYSFPWEHPKALFSKEQQGMIGFQMKRIWANPRTEKIAHNLKFEHVWTRKKFSVRPANWKWCTLMGARCQDNRPGWSGLKFQVYVQFGHRPYNDPVAPYMDSHGEEFNRMDECPLDILLPYGGLDTRWTRKLYEKQVDFYDKNPKMKQGFDLFNKGAISLGNMQYNGINTDIRYCQDTKKEIEEKIELIEDKLTNSSESVKFKEHTGRELVIKEKDYSDHDLRTLFYDVLNYDTEVVTAKSGKKSVSKDTISSFDSPFVKLILKRRKLRKIIQKFEEFLRCSQDGLMHPFFDLIIPVSYRGSCSLPNFQNVSKRDPQAKKYIRRAIKAREGRKILESDFSGLEVCFNACYNKDPNLIKYIKDPSTDMHRDTAGELFMLPKEEIEKMIRFFTKNMWVFAQFYGSWYKECAKNLWGIHSELKANSGFTISDHFKSKGIFTLEQFTSHCERVEKSFWEVRFKVYNQWKKDVQKEYQENGFTETHLGLRFSQLMSKNEITNYKAQGTGFHCLLWTLIKVEDTMIKEGMKSLLIGQIHDSLLTDLHPDEEKMQIDIINHWGTKEVKKEWKWINVPLKIDHEVTDIDGTWYDLKEAV